MSILYKYGFQTLRGRSEGVGLFGRLNVIWAAQFNHLAIQHAIGQTDWIMSTDTTARRRKASNFGSLSKFYQRAQTQIFEPLKGQDFTGFNYFSTFKSIS